MGIEKKEVAFLNDLRYNTLMLPWMDFLNMLGGMEVHIPTLKSHFTEDPAGEDAMMDSRWKEWRFHYSIPKGEQKKMPSCARCFAELVH